MVIPVIIDDWLSLVYLPSIFCYPNFGLALEATASQSTGRRQITCALAIQELNGGVRSHRGNVDRIASFIIGNMMVNNDGQ